MPSEKPKLKGLLLVGPEIPITDEIRKLYSQEGYKIIGDGNRFITETDLDELRGQIDAGTRLDIFGHGDVKNKNSFLKKKSHLISLVKGTTQTSDILAKLKDITEGTPLEAHIWSCYGGLAARDAASLARGSCVIAHSSETQTINMTLGTQGLIESVSTHQTAQRKDGVRSYLDYQQIMDSIHLGAGQKTFIGISGVTGIVGCRHRSDRIPTPISVRSVFKKFMSNLGKKISRLQKNLPQDVRIPNPHAAKRELTDAETTHFVKQNFFYNCFKAKRKFIRAVQNPNNRDLVTSIQNTYSADSHSPLLAAALSERESLVSPLLITGINSPSNQTILQNLYLAKPQALVPFINKAKATEASFELLLLAKNANTGFTLLHLATAQGDRKTIKEIFKLAKSENIDITKLLNTQDKKGKTPLQSAIINENSEIVGLLLTEAKKANANLSEIIEIKGFMGLSAIELADKVENPAIISSLHPFKKAPPTRAETKMPPSISSLDKNAFAEISQMGAAFQKFMPKHSDADEHKVTYQPTPSRVNKKRSIN